jgi:ComF family protein
VRVKTQGGLPVWALGYHEEPLQGLVHRLKYRSETFVADWLGAKMSRLPVAWSEVDGILPVPLHPERLAERGYNQSALLARKLGSRHKRVVLFGAATRRAKTNAQAELGRKEREANMVDAFEASRACDGTRVLIVDDVVTTGSTADSLAKALRSAGYGVLGIVAVSVARPK